MGVRNTNIWIISILYNNEILHTNLKENLSLSRVANSSSNITYTNHTSTPKTFVEPTRSHFDPSIWRNEFSVRVLIPS